LQRKSDVLNALLTYLRLTALGHSQHVPVMSALEAFVHAAEHDPAVVVPPSFKP
jgi:hypothetical protein